MPVAGAIRNPVGCDNRDRRQHAIGKAVGAQGSAHLPDRWALLPRSMIIAWQDGNITLCGRDAIVERIPMGQFGVERAVGSSR